jgi:hypothetical protein
MVIRVFHLYVVNPSSWHFLTFTTDNKRNTFPSVDSNARESHSITMPFFVIYAVIEREHVW